MNEVDALSQFYLARRPARLKPVAILQGEALSIVQATEKHGVPRETARRWCEKFGIGAQWGRGSKWQISEPGLRMVKDGNWQALSLLRNGIREESDLVQPYLLNGCENNG